LKESYFKQEKTATSIIEEDTESESADDSVVTSSMMESYLQAIRKGGK
jgi:hypothetical protein